MNRTLQILVLSCCGHVLSASMIDFNGLAQGVIPAGYGSTAEVAISYKSYNAANTLHGNYARNWDSGYSNLTDTAYADPGLGSKIEVIFTPIAGYSVTIQGFTAVLYLPFYATLGSGESHTATINGSLSGNYFTDTNLLTRSGIPGTTDRFDYLPAVSGLVGEVLILRIDPAWRTGLDNIVFEATKQGGIPIPEPSSLLMLALGVGLVGLRRFHRK